MANGYAIVIGLALILVGGLGFVKTEAFGLHFNLTHNLIHLISGLIGLAVGLTGGDTAAMAYARALGVIYTVVALVGFVGKPEFLISVLNLNPAYNVIHIAVGLLGLLVGFSGAKTAAA
jgi:hypothetical protein